MRGRVLRRNDGYTLLEVIVVMAIIAILAGLATLSLAEFLPGLRLRRASQELQLQLQKARLEAVRRNRNCCVEFHKQVGGKRYAPIIWVEDDGDSVFEAGEEIVYRQEVAGGTLELDGYGGIRFNPAQGGGDGVTFTGNAFRFDSRGLCRPAGGAIHLLNNKGREKIINVTLGGAVRIR